MKERLEQSFILIAILSLSYFAGAQETRGLSVGDTCPDVYIKKIINSPVAQAHLSSWKGKMVLLDFMTSRCSSCIKALPKMDSIQQLFKNRIFIAAVTQEKSPAVDKLLEMDYLKSCRVSFIIEDTILHNLFPHISIPHVVWLDENRVVKAITYSEYITAENIQSALDKPKLDWLVKKEIPGIDGRTPLLTWNGEIIAQPAAMFYSAFSSHLPGVQRNNIIVIDSANKTVSYCYKNQTILNLFRNALMSMNKADFLGKTFLIETPDTRRFIYTADVGYRDEWKFQNTFCYEAKFPLSMSALERGRVMINDLNRFLNLNAHFEYRLIKVWQIIPGDGAPPTEKRHLYAARKLSDFVHQLNSTKDFPLIVINEGDRKIALSVNPSKIKTQADFECELKENRLKFVPVMKEIEVFVIKQASAQ